jgi:hypothetical protein
MRRPWLELRIGLIAGLTASAVLWAVQQASVRASSASLFRATSSDRWIPPLVDPVTSAQDALHISRRTSS